MQIISRPPKFLFVIDSLSSGGAQRQMVNLATGLKQRGYQIEFYCYAPGDLLGRPLISAGINIHWHYKRSRYSPKVIFDLKQKLKQGKFDLVLSFLPTPNLYAILVSRILSFPRVPVIVSERRVELPGGAAFREQLARQTYRLATHITTNSYHQKSSLVKKFPWIQGHLTTIYNGYDLQNFYSPKAEPDNHPIKILVIASVVPRKNGLCLVEALNILRKKYDYSPCVDWIGKQDDMPEHFIEMNSLIRSYGLDEQWQWLNERNDIVEQLHTHDVIVHPSYVEGLPNVVCEALACARPVIVSNTLDHPRIVQDGESGYLFDWQDPNDLAEKIKAFSLLPASKRKEMGSRGRKYAKENLSLDRYIDKYEQLFLSVLTNKNG